MVLTNEDLKRVKGRGGFWCVNIEERTALIHRLEAAEKCAQGLANLVELSKLKGSPKKMVEDWKKSKGE